MGETTATSPDLDELPRCTRVFAPEKTAARAARQYVERTLAAWGLPLLIDDAKVIITELVTNALLHGAGPIVVEFSISEDEEFLMEVGDSSRQMPEIHDPDVWALGGRGLIIIEGIADACGERLTDDGKVTWATLFIS